MMLTVYAALATALYGTRQPHIKALTILLLAFRFFTIAIWPTC